MKKTITRTVLATLVLLLSLTFSSYAQIDYHDVYICGNTSVKLRPQESIINATDKVHWYLEGVEVAGSPFTYSTSGSADLTIPANLAVGLHKYTTAIESVGGCIGEISEPYEIYKLPTKTLALTKSVGTYCGANSAVNGTSGSVITATTTPAASLPAGVEYAYTWSVTEGGNAATPGSADNSTTATSQYTMTTSTVGTYIFNASVKYALSAGNTGTLVSADTQGCSVDATATQTVIVTPKPGKPTISLAN